jgi:hypothetical protein
MRLALREPLPAEIWPLFGAKARPPPLPAAATGGGGGGRGTGKGAQGHANRPVRQRKQVVNSG